MAIKTYVLLDHLKPTAQIYQQINKEQRVKLDTLPQWRPYLQITFVDLLEKIIDYNPKSKTYKQEVDNPKKGENRTIRLKLNSNTPYQDEQIEREKILANEKFSQSEYDSIKFIHNTLVTGNPAVQAYLEVYPAYDKFKGICEQITQPSYKLYNPTVEIKSENVEFKKRLKAANKIASLELKEAQDLLIRIFGTFYEVPKDVEEAQNALVNYMDGSDDALNDILKEDTTIDDEVQVLLGRLVSEGKISFDAVEGQVVKKKGDGWINLKAISNEYTPLERQRYFSEFLTSQAGKLLLDDMRTEAISKVKVKNNNT